MKIRTLKSLLKVFDGDIPGKESNERFAAWKEFADAIQFIRMENKNNEINHPEEFSPFFTEKVMSHVRILSAKPSMEEYISRQFFPVLTYGFSTLVVLLLILIFLHNGDVTGVFSVYENSNELNFISSLFYEY